MPSQIKEVFETHCDHVNVNRKLVKLMRNIRLNFANRNEDHVNFFTGNLLGVYPVRYRTVDRDYWFDEVLEVSEGDISDALKKVDAIDPSWVRASDAVNNSCIWLLHKIHNDTTLSVKEREQGLRDVCLMLQYKFLSSIMAHYFPYSSDRSIAIATFESLSRKFELKQHGSWQAFLNHRCENILSKSSIHYETYVRMNDDDAIVYMISDIQKRLRDVVKKMTTVFNKVKEDNLRISSTSSVMEIEGDMELIDKARDHTSYVRYIKEIITDKTTFVRMELVNAVNGILQSLPQKHLLEALDYSSDNFGRGGDKDIEKLLESTLFHVFTYISENEGVMKSPSDLPNLMVKLRNLYMASRMSDPQLIEMRDLSEKIVKKSVSTRNKASIASLRTGLQLYIVVRAFAKKHYQG